jgi:hypothetical protein
MGESETIFRHPDLIDAIVAAGRDPIASATDLAEFRAILPPLGASLIPDTQLGVVSPGHAVWFGKPEADIRTLMRIRPLGRRSFRAR